MRRLCCIVLAAWLALPHAFLHAQVAGAQSAAATSKVSLTRRYVYDAHQRLCKIVEPETGATVIAYDDNGNPVSTASGLALPSTMQCDTTHPSVAARRILRTYDARNRVATLRFPDGRGDTDYRYTHGDRLASMTTANGGGDVIGASYTYNLRGWPATETSARPGRQWTLRHAYDRNGHRASMVYPDTYVVRFEPDALGRPTRVGNFATGIRWFPNGAVRQFTYGNGIVHTVAQNARGLPDRRRDALGSVVALDDSYDYDRNGNVVAISDALGGRGHRTMAYDALDRLRSVASPMFGSAAYAYDALDNPTRTRITGGNAPRDHHYCYDASWRLTNVKTGSCAGTSVVGLGYDAQGNLSNRNGVAHAFDFGNRLRGVGGGPGSHYLYDGHGRRVRDTTTGTKDSLYSLAGQLAYVRDLRAGKTRHYLYLQDRLVGTRETDHASGAVAHRYLHADALGSPVAVTDAQRRVVERTEHEPYGTASNRPSKDGPAYTGHVEDAATGLLYAQQRYYDARIPRFLSVDPVTADAGDQRHFNRYAYAYANPYRFVDTDGRQSRDFNWMSREAGFRPPPRAEGDWLGPAIGVGLAAISLPAIAIGGWELSLAALANPAAVATGMEVVAGVAGVGGVAPMLKGQDGVARSIAAAAARGQVLRGREITLSVGKVTTRPDLLVRKPDGRLMFIESKCGPHACLSGNQRQAFPIIEAGGAIPRGRNAQAAGLVPGRPLGPTEVQVDWWD